MSKKAADHHQKASEHHEKAAFHHAEAAKHHLMNAFEKAAHHASLAQAHQQHATHHMGEALQAHLTDHGSGLSPQNAAPRSPFTSPGEVKKFDIAADNMKGTVAKAPQDSKDAAKKTRESKNTGERSKKHNR